MDGIVAVIRSSPGQPLDGKRPDAKQYDAELRAYVIRLSKLSAALVVANASEILENLNPTADTIPCLVVLEAALRALDQADANTRVNLLNKTVGFLLKFDPYLVRYAGDHFVNILEMIESGTLFPPRVTVELIASSILRIDPTGSVFTSAHLWLARLALESNYVAPALKVIDRDISFYPDMEARKASRMWFDKTLDPTSYISSSTGLTLVVKSSTVLEYNLLCGLIYISLRDWAKAQRSLERVVSHPLKDRITSKFMTEGYKKWILVGLINAGEPPTLPSYTSASAKNAYGIVGQAYDNLAKEFVTRNAAQVKADVDANVTVWEEDGNKSLVDEVIAAYQKWQIINLRYIYQPVSVARIRNLTVSAETGRPFETDQEVVGLVQRMVASGMLQGDLHMGKTADESYLTFKEDDSFLSEKDFAREVAQLHHNIESLGKHYQQTNERLSSSKEYVRHMIREQKMLAAKEEGDGRKLDFDEEDLMTDVMPH